MAYTNYDYCDMYIISPDDAVYRNEQLIEDNTIKVIIQKIKMILLTNPDDVFEVFNDTYVNSGKQFGSGLLYYLHETKLSASTIENILNEQFITYIPELDSVAYQIQVEIFDDNDYSEWMLVKIQLDEYQFGLSFR